MWFNKKKVNKKMNATPKKMGLALGGGGARGFAEIGAIKAFRDAGIEFDIIVGTSVGSIVGALYAADLPYDYIMHLVDEINVSDIHGRILFKPEQPTKLAAQIRKIFGNVNIEDLKRKYACVATDLITAKQAILDKGDLAKSISASCAVPIAFSPVEIDGMHLLDGGLTNNIPSEVCKLLGAEKVVAIDVNPTRAAGTTGTGLIETLKTVFSIVNANASVFGRMNADVFIPIETSKFSAASKDGYREMIELGYQATLEHMDEVRALFV